MNRAEVSVITEGSHVDADRALTLAYSDPNAAEALGGEAFSRAITAGDHAAASIAARAVGIAARERHDLTKSLAFFRQAVRVAERGGLPPLAGQARLSLLGTLALRGKWAEALREAELAEPTLTGVDLARLKAQRAMVLRANGRPEDAIEGFRQALVALRRHRDDAWKARVYVHRGLARYQIGDLAAADADLRRADELFRGMGQHRLAANARQNLAMVVGLRGDIPLALTLFEEADEYLAQLGETDAMSLNDRCLVLMAARLVPDARRCAELAVEVLEHEGRIAYLAQAQLKLAEAAFLAGDLAATEDIAERAREAFTRQRRPTWSALARLVAARAAWVRGDRSPALLDSVRRAAEVLVRHGFTTAALDARLLVAQLAIAQGRTRIACRQLVLASSTKRAGTVQIRARAWHADALLRLQHGDRRRAESAVRAGMNLLDRYRATLGATELRAHASGHAEDLARLGLRLAVESGRARNVLKWAERFRAATLQFRPARPPEDAHLAAGLAELRSVVVQLEATRLAGRPTAALVARQEALEEVVKKCARHATGFLAASLQQPPTVAELSLALGHQALVEMVECDGALHAVVVADGRARLHWLCPLSGPLTELESLGFSLRRLVFRQGTPASLAAAAEVADFAAKRLDDLLLAPVASQVGHRPLVIVPTGPLHALPWSMLPSCTDRPVTVAPSAAVWYRSTVARQAGGTPDSVALIAGPGLSHAGREINELGRRFYPSAVRLTGRKATSTAVCSALGTARLAHVAAHGRFRRDNPLFSSLQLVDGPLTVYDLEGVRQAPSTMILSACESGVSAVQPGDELMGLTAALLALGTRAVIASVLQVPDDATRPFMLAFHRALRLGLAPAAALARAQSDASEWAVRSPDGRDARRDRVAAGAFVCFGAGSET